MTLPAPRIPRRRFYRAVAPAGSYEPAWGARTNDFLWWVPFGAYLRDAWPWFRADLGGSGAAVRA